MGIMHILAKSRGENQWRLFENGKKGSAFLPQASENAKCYRVE